MRFKAVLAATHETERVLSRHIPPHGLGYQLTLLLQVIRYLERREGHTPWHPVSGLLALILTDLGVVVTRYSLDPPQESAAIASAGVLNTRQHSPDKDEAAETSELGLSVSPGGAP